MMMAFEAKNNAGFLDGSIPQPTEDDLLFLAWRRCNSMLKSWILNTISKEISSSLLYIRSAPDVWKELKERYFQSNCSRVFQLKKSLASLNKGSLSVTTYYTQLKVVWDELREYQPNLDPQNHITRPWAEYLQEKCVLQFLMGLNDSYAQLRAQVPKSLLSLFKKRGSD